MKKMVIVMAMVFTLAISCSVYGAASVSVSKSSVNVGDTFTVSATVSSVASWGIFITPTGPVQFVGGTTSSADATSNALNGTYTMTATYKATGNGTATFNLSGDTTTESGDNSNVSGSKSVSISTPVATTPTTTTPTSTTTTQASTNAYLKKLTISAEGLNPAFSKSKTAYSVNVKENITNIDVSATAEDSRATVYVTGNKNLVIGENIITITVTAQDKTTKKTYKISVIKSNNPELSDASLKSLIVEGLNLGVDFDPNITEYNCSEVESNVEKLNILAYPTNEKAKVEIIGNDVLQVGANTINIKVTSEGGTVIKEYFLKFNKKEAIVAETVNIYAEVNELKTKEPSRISKLTHSILGFIKRHWLDLTLATICLLELGQIIYLYRKVKKLKSVDKINIEDKVEPKTSRRRNNKVETIPTETVVNNENEEVVEEKKDELSETVQEENLEPKAEEEDNNTEEVESSEDNSTDEQE